VGCINIIFRLKALIFKKNDLNMVSKTENLRMIPELPVFGDTFEERVYCRLKGSASPIFLKKK